MLTLSHVFTVGSSSSHILSNIRELAIHDVSQHNNSGTFFHIAQSPPPQLFDHSTFHTLVKASTFYLTYSLWASFHLSPVHALRTFIAMQFYHSYSSSTMVEFYLLAFSRFTLRKKKHKFWGQESNSRLPHLHFLEAFRHADTVWSFQGNFFSFSR